MNILADTHILLWASDAPRKLPKVALSLLTDIGNDLYFSPLSIWEVSIKGALGRKDFQFDPRMLRRNLLNNARVAGNQAARDARERKHVALARGTR